jgi:DNA polymerase sigma
MQQDIEDFFQLAQPSANERATRVTCIERIQRAINNVNLTHQNTRPAAGYTCFPFGSTLTGIDTAGSDLDLCIIDNDRLDGFVGRYRRQDLPALHNMRALAHVLRKSGFSNVEPIVNAAVPICKFQFYFRGVRIVGDANCASIGWRKRGVR